MGNQLGRFPLPQLSCFLFPFSTLPVASGMGFWDETLTNYRGAEFYVLSAQVFQKFLTVICIVAISPSG